MKFFGRIRSLLKDRSRADLRATAPAPSERRRSEAVEALTKATTADLLAGRAQLQAAAQDAGLTPDEIGAVLNARPDLPRRMLPIERDTLLAVLSHADFEGRDQLVAQVDLATVVGYCGCGCASVDLEVTADAPRAPGTPSPIPNSATVLDARGDEIGGVIVFLNDGCLSLLEIYDWLDTPGISPLPPVDRLRFEQDWPGGQTLSSDRHRR